MAAQGQVIYRRRFPRRRFNRPVGVLADGHYEVALSSEISEGGMMILATTTLPVGKRLVATFVIPGSEHVIVQGEVRYHQPTKDSSVVRMGVAFTNIEFNQKRMIREYIAKKTEAEANQDSSPSSRR